jgi:phosphosulfolactate phosphohydrolase-like enzyme
MLVEKRSLAALGDEPLGFAVVIDVLRMTSTATVLAARGATSMLVAATPVELEDLPPPRGSYLLVSELAGVDSPLPRIDNSPVLAGRVALERQTPVLVTTNGTRVLGAVAGRAERTLLASLLNLTATVQHLRRCAPHKVTLIPAGDVATGQPRVEDEACAEALAALLEARACNLEELIAHCRRDPRIVARLARQGAPFAADLDLALSVDRYDLVLDFELLGAGVGVVQPRAPAVTP